MSWNVGGILVRWKPGLTRDRVAAQVDAYWRGRGAKRSSRDPKTFDTLSLGKTGRLGYAILGAPDEWIAVCDSERYTADPDLAKDLAGTLATETIWYVLNGAVNEGACRIFGGKTRPPPRTYAAVEKFIRKFPFACFHFDDFDVEIEDLSPAQRKDVRFLAFEGIRHRPRAVYSGPDLQALKAERSKTQLLEARSARDGRAALRLARRKDSGLSPAELADQLFANLSVQDPAQRAFALTLLAAPFLKEQIPQKAYLPLLEVAVLERNGALLARLAARIGEVDVYYRSGFHADLYNLATHFMMDGKVREGLTILDLAAAQKVRKPLWQVYDNALVAFLLVQPAQIRDREEALSRIRQATPFVAKNPSFHHNFACLYARMGDPERALKEVGLAVKRGYKLLERMRTDADLKSLHADPRFIALFKSR